MTRKRRNHSPEFKAKLVLDAAKGDKTVVELVQKYNLHVKQISAWKKEPLENSAMILGPKCSVVSRAQRKSSLVKSTPLPIKRQC
ncbi:hypothetical protein VCHE48_0342 [Vibrio cholerae HE48]|nr:hypothetical protein VCHE48_0342 [Vibrio cholerae HE48]